MQWGQGTGTDADGVDAADLWVRDPHSGEYRLRLPGEAPPARAAEPTPAVASTASSARTAEPAPAATPVRTRASGGRAAERRGRRQHSGPWVAAMGCFLLLVGAGGAYALLHSPGGGGAAAAGPGQSPSGSASGGSCPARPSSAATPAAEPAVSGAFLAGAHATAINVRVTVLNGTGTIGRAEGVLSWMQNSERFLRSSNGGPAPVLPATTLVYAANHVDQARTLAVAMGLPASALHGTATGAAAKAADGRMVLTLGQDFHGIGKPFAAPSSAASAEIQTPAGCGSQ